MEVITCPSCGSEKIEKVRRNWQGKYQGKAYTVRELEFYKCPNCGESVYGREAIRRIEAESPAFRKSPTEKKSA
ncbi:MAG: type II toxin-antitoxin system MqsA family antitoxin [Acidobacteria bacterium]|nr:type II toxin-antitoxin system MqsA family antitoxin [Acidobacteriota bacterium]